MYDSISELPSAVKRLPYNGRRIYMKFFNRAYKNYKSKVSANSIAWSAVKRKYYKKNYRWLAYTNDNDFDTTDTENDDYDTE
ncbi:chaB-like protein [Cryptophlebia peltastica nucleopolyhedrovirus]|uniref:ChaB-like protein n=1 Tax=Cryptophlebia peltastica nucleopolyhedrovirus TaxID=2304025 RepID=A0A346RNR4_9ABAC|nr:chaB-like protein [Cryptophlebia peltastica nucleopolyhedrovirus]AXS67711.1 chaB-like protein [Cryptophlebia peltastica nucleopolyhedrovirus]